MLEIVIMQNTTLV